MPITDATATKAPPLFHYHQFVSNDTVEDLNAWATSIFSPEYSATSPAFAPGLGGLTYLVGGRPSGVPIPVGYFIVFDPMGTLSVLDSTDFARLYVPSA